MQKSWISYGLGWFGRWDLQDRGLDALLFELESWDEAMKWGCESIAVSNEALLFGRAPATFELARAEVVTNPSWYSEAATKELVSTGLALCSWQSKPVIQSTPRFLQMFVDLSTLPPTERLSQTTVVSRADTRPVNPTDQVPINSSSSTAFSAAPNATLSERS